MNKEKISTDFPETCPRCGTTRTMIDEGRAFFGCGADTGGTSCGPCIFCGQSGIHDCPAFPGRNPKPPRSVCAMCGEETEAEMRPWESRGGKIKLFLCPPCDQEMTAMAVRS
jgi:hypothetical protein